MARVHETTTKGWLNLVSKFRIFCCFVKCHEVRDTHAPILFGLVAADLWLCVCIFVPAVELGHISISCDFLHFDMVLHRGVLSGQWD